MDSNLSQHLDSAYHGVFSYIPVTIQYNTHTSSQGPAFLILYDHRGLYKSILGSKHTSFISSSGHKKLSSVKHWSIMARAGQHSLLGKRTHHFLIWFTSTRALFSMDSRISYHWEGSDGAAWWVGGAWMTHYVLMFWAHEVFSVVSDSLWLEGGRFCRSPFCISTRRMRASIAIITTESGLNRSTRVSNSTPLSPVSM
jgi:hypothetical protein